jgi:hypothetical protein
MHPACAQAEAAQAPSNRKKAPVAVIVAGVGVFVTVAAVWVVTLKQEQRSYEERQAQEAAARAKASEDQAKAEAARAPKEHTGFLYCDAKKGYCHPTEQQAIKLYGTRSDFAVRFGVECRRRSGLCLEPATPSIVLTPGTKVVVLAEVPIESAQAVRFDEGPHKGKRAFVDEKYVHDAPPH